MPRKRGSVDPLKLAKQIEKEQERLFIQAWVDFFNQDPVEYLRNMPYAHQFGFDEIFRNPKAQETLRQSFKRVADAIKAVIVAYEDLWQGRTKEDGVKALQKAADALDSLIELKVTYRLGVSNAGIVREDPVVYEAKSKIDFVHPLIRDLVANKVGHFKSWISQYKEHLPIGVCRYERCSKFFAKERRDQRFCSEKHATYARIKRHRIRLRKQHN